MSIQVGRVHLASEIVVNIEIVDEDYMADFHTRQFDYQLIPFTDDQPAWIGFGWDIENGFDQPPLLHLPDVMEHPEPVYEWRALMASGEIQ